MVEPIPIRFKLLRRFYEPILLAAALNELRFRGYEGPQREPNTAGDNADTAEEAFQFFVNRLAQVCDSRKGGDTVSAVAVLQEADCIHYIVGSNKRKPDELREVEDFLTNLLKVVAASHTLQLQNLNRSLLHLVLRYNKSRVKVYVGQVANHLVRCIADYEAKQATNSIYPDLRQDLMELRQRTNFRSQDELTEVQYLNSCEELITWIHRRAKHTQFEEFLALVSKDGLLDRNEQWMNLRHNLGRLRSYQLAVDAIIRISRRLNPLFHEFKVTAIPSASTIQNPLMKMNPNAHGIIGRMMSGDEIIAYRDKAEKLQQFGLDEAIRDQMNDKSCSHRVHAEVLVLNYVLEHMRNNEAARFWNGWEYVGASKPVCQLCEYYFLEHDSGVKTRKGHGNLYPNWRFPDIFQEGRVAARDRLLDKIIQRIRKDARRSMNQENPQPGRWHDSNSFSDSPFSWTARTDTASVSEMGRSVFSNTPASRIRRTDAVSVSEPSSSSYLNNGPSGRSGSTDAMPVSEPGPSSLNNSIPSSWFGSTDTISVSELDSIFRSMNISLQRVMTQQRHAPLDTLSMDGNVDVDEEEEKDENEDEDEDKKEDEEDEITFPWPRSSPRRE